MKKIPIRENGLVGTLFSCENATKAVIVLGGSSGGIPEERAEKLAQNGFTALALGYFAAESLPSTLNQIPLEYFEKAIEQMRLAGFEKIALWGGSRGAELSLILGALFSDRIDAIAAHVPSSVVFGAFDDQDTVAWTYQGKPIAPNAPFQYTQQVQGETEDTSIKITPCFIKAMEKKDEFEAAAIPVENLKCSLLLISGEDDQMWPSSLFAEQIVERLKNHDSPIFYTHIKYPDVGHSPMKGTSGFHPVMQRWFSFGGNPEANALAAEDWFRQTVHFFNEQL
jgi:acetyl esterase/lipase